MKVEILPFCQKHSRMGRWVEVFTPPAYLGAGVYGRASDRDDRIVCEECER